MKTLILKLFFTTCLTMLSGSVLLAQSSEAITVNRNTGVAPLSVYFDASGALGSEEGAFHNYNYQWDFGDDPNDVWNTSGKSKNEATGPVAAHVFEKPGSYQVRLSVHNSSGEVLSDVITITVTDPDVVFSGTDTKCISSTGDFTGCPAGSEQLTLSNFSDIRAHLSSNTRILLRRGETWDVDGTLTIQNAENVTFGAFGNGESPRLVANEARSVISFMSNRQNANWRILDMDIESPGDVSRYPAVYPGDQLLLKNVEVEGFVGMIQGGRVGSDKKENLFIIDSYLHDIRGALDLGALGNAVYMGGHAMAIMGTTIDNTERGEHLIRITETTGTVISHNVFSNPGEGRHAIKLHARCFTTNVSGESCAPSREYTENIVISDNQISGRLNDWDVVIGPQSKDYDEAVRKVLVERNHFTHPSSVDKTSLVICSSDITIRNNVFQNFGASHVATYVFQRGIEAIPNNVYIYNNTMVNGSGTATLANAGDGTNINVMNNLLAGSSASALTMLSGTASGSVNSSHNLTTTDFNIFQNGTNFPFNLADGSAPVDAGTAVPVVLDYNRQSRPMGSGYDIGAYEYESSGNTEDTVPPSAPSNVQVANVTATSIDLSWNASSDNIGVTHYQVELITGSTVVDMITAAGTSVSLTGLTSGTQYQLSVTAFDAAGNRSTAGVATATTTESEGDTTPPTIPANLTASNVTENSVTLSWDPATDNDAMDHYELFQDDVSTPVATILAANPTTTNITGLTAATTYSFAIRAVDVAGNASALSDPVVVTTADDSSEDTESPTIPTNFQVTEVTSTTVSLSWDPSTDNVGVTGYNVYQKDVPAPVITVSGTSAVVSGLSPSTFYKFKVAALDAAGNESEWSNAVDAFTLDPDTAGDTIPPTRPSSVSVANVDFTSLDLSWGASTDNVGVAYYQIEMIDETEGPYDTLGIITTSDTVIFLTDLLDGTFYQFRITAFDEAGNQSDAARGGAFTTDQIPPTVPANLTASNVTESSVTLSWDHATDNWSMDLYEIFQNGASSPATSVFYTDSTTTITGLSLATTYSFTIRAVDWNGNASALSDPLTVTTTGPSTPDTQQPATPTSFQVSEVTSSSISLSWNPSTDNIGVTGYNVYQWGISGPVTTVPRTSATISGLTPSTYYKFKVTALDQAGNESWQTSAVDATTLSMDDPGDTIPPTRPSNMIVTVGYTSIDLSWDASTDDVGVAHYQVVTTIDESEDTVGVITLTETSISVNDLEHATSYRLQVTAFDATGNQSSGAVVITRTHDGMPPTVPTNLTATNITENSVMLSWDPSTDNYIGVDFYEIFQDGSSVLTTQEGPIEITGLSPLTTYTFAVRAEDFGGNESAFSDTLTITTASPSTPDTEQPATPTNLQVTEVTSSSISLTWDPSTDNIGVTGYNVYQWGISGPVTTVPGTSATLSGLTPSTYYKFKVTALDRAGNESWQTSAVDAVTTSTSARQSTNNEMTSDNVTMSLYPNPATSVIHLVTAHKPNETFEIKMTDLSGKEINRWIRQGNNHTLDLSGYDRGIYLIQIAGLKPLIKKIILK